MKHSLALILLSTALTAQTTLTIDTTNVRGKVSPMLYGLMTEEINFSYDGGLYAELIRNRSFHAGWSEPEHWFLMPYGNARAEMAMDNSTSPNPERKLSLKFAVAEANANSPAALGNEGYWGIPVRPNTTYRVSFYAKSDTDIGPVTASIVSDDSGKPVASRASEPITKEWKKYHLTLSTGAVQSSAANRFVLSVTHPGIVWFDMVSLFPPTYHNRENGNRIDLMEKLAAMKPAFLRFPGGNYLEGDTIRERFQWKKTIGPLVDRPTHPSPWNYWSSDGMGLLEFLEWCEDLHMSPVLAVYAGYSLKGEHVNPGPDLEPYVQDALEEIEYVTGSADTKWGAVRARDGHPAPFSVQYVEIGNEDSFDKSGSYDGRFAQLFKAIKAKYSNLQLIATAPVQSVKPDVIDDHYYKRADEMFAMTDHYDHADRNGPKVFVGEWATREGSPTPDFNAALGDAAWMTGLERNSDLVIMASYAPLFVNVNPGGMQWATDLIGYDAMNSYGSPSYYAQVMFSNHIGTEILDAKLTGDNEQLFYSATRGAGTIYLKVVNPSTAAQTVHVALDGAAHVNPQATLIQLKARARAETNSSQQPTKIVPASSTASNIGSKFDYTFAPLSINILEINVR